jgi:hypothetical protein
MKPGRTQGKFAQFSFFAQSMEHLFLRVNSGGKKTLTHALHLESRVPRTLKIVADAQIGQSLAG